MDRLQYSLENMLKMLVPDLQSTESEYLEV